MNFWAVLKLLGLLICLIGLSMVFSLGWSFYYADGAAGAILLSMAITGAIGLACYLLGRSYKQELFRKETLAVVGVGWLLTAGFGALPYVFSGVIPDYIGAYFEAMSGFTTTGSTVLTQVESQPPSILFWRSFTHWLGGMGIIVLFIAVLPFLGVGGRRLFKTEVPGPIKEKLTPKIKETAEILWKIYLLLSVVETLLLLAMGLNLFDSMCHTFATLATGGFSTKNSSIAHFDYVGVELVIIAFMFLAGTNFGLHFRAVNTNFNSYLRDPEWRTYAGILSFSIIFISLDLYIKGHSEQFLAALRWGAFQATSVMTTTGFTTADFNKWPSSSRILLVSLMFIGASAGSTGGGMKVMRIQALFKIALAQLHRVYRPRMIKKVKIGRAVISEEIQKVTLSFFFIFMALFVICSLLMAAIGLDLVTAVASVAATINNIGPGLELVGAIENYSHIAQPGKILLSLCMVMGRLELFSILVLFLPEFWRSR